MIKVLQGDVIDYRELGEQCHLIRWSGKGPEELKQFPFLTNPDRFARTLALLCCLQSARFIDAQVQAQK